MENTKLTLNIKEFQSDLGKTTAYADELNKKTKIRSSDVRDAVKQQETFETFAKCAYFYHKGIAENDRAITTHTSFGQFLSEVTGFHVDEKFGFNLSLLKACGFNENSFLGDIAQAHTKFSSASTVANQGYRWLIPQIIQAVAYQSSTLRPAKYKEWITNQMNVGDAIEVVKPIVQADDATPYIGNEFQSITYATVSFAQKTVRFTKLQKGFKLGRKQMALTTIPMLPLLTRAVTNGFEKAMDTLALLALLNGDQADLSEAAKTTGIQTANTLTYKDLLRLKTRSSRLGVKYNKMLTSEATALGLASLPEFLGTTNSTGYVTMPLKLASDFYPNINTLDVHGAYPANDSILFFNTADAAQLLVQRPMNIESEFSLDKEETTFYARNEFAFMTGDLLARMKMDLTTADETFHAIFDADVLEGTAPMTW